MPERERVHVLKVMNYMENKMAVKGPHMFYLFEVYNEYFCVRESEEEDYECANCRSKVFYKYRKLVELLEKLGE